MEDIIGEFIDEMRARECAPARMSQIIADDKRRSYLLDGEKNASASYKLKIDGEFGVGYFKNFKTGETHAWHSKSSKKLTLEERAAIKRRVAAERAAQEAEQRKRYDEVAQECRKVWDAAPEADSHPYAIKKQVRMLGCRVHGDMLLVPMYKNGKISSLQRIWPNGDKRFWEDGEVTGAYAPLAEHGDDKSTLVICEGWADGVSIRMATGLPVVVGFTASNLGAVALSMREKYPRARLILAADNDAFTFRQGAKRPADYREISGDDPRWEDWRTGGALQNVGIQAAQNAAVKIGAHVIWPEFPTTPERHKDFNDLHRLIGLDAVKLRILAAVPASMDKVPDRGSADSYLDYDQESAPPPFDEIPIEAYEEEFQSLYELPALPQDDAVDDESWRQRLYFNDKNQIVARSLQNIQLILENHKDFKGLICTDEFAHEKVVTRCPVWEREPARFKTREFRDEDVTQIASQLELMNMYVNKANLTDVMNVVIQNERRNPAQEYFTRLVWDGVPRLNTWLREYCGCSRDNDEYLAAIGRKWMTAAVRRVFEPGCKFDHILIFEGRPDLGKSLMLKDLATIHGRAYFDDTIKASDLLLGDKVVPKLQGVLIIELAEMSGFKKMDKNAVKQVFTTTSDRIIPKYSNNPVTRPRQFVFAGTINPADGYLDDPTGNRRYWPAYCTRIDMEGIHRDKEQLWAEAVTLYRVGEKVWMDTPQLKRLAEEEQRKRNQMHPWQAEIEDLCGNRRFIGEKELWEGLFIVDRTKRTKQAAEDIGKIMAVLGYENRRKSLGGERVTGWHLVTAEAVEAVDDNVIWGG